MPAQYRNQNQIIATGDKDTQARQIWGHSFYKFSRKWSQPEFLYLPILTFSVPEVVSAEDDVVMSLILSDKFYMAVSQR